MRIKAKYKITLLFVSVSMAGADDFPKWSKSEARSVALRSFEHGSESFGKAFGKGMLGQIATMAAFWVTDPGARAVARITQLEERGREDRATQAYKALREESDSTYLLVICTSSMQALFPSAYPSFGSAEPQRLAKIFLEDEKDESKFVRALNIEAVPFDIGEVFGRRVMMMSEGFMLRFSRLIDDGTPLVKDLNQKIRLRLPTSREKIESGDREPLVFST